VNVVTVRPKDDATVFHCSGGCYLRRPGFLEDCSAKDKSGGVGGGGGGDDDDDDDDDDDVLFAIVAVC
jgi:hypothetical protein